MLSTINPQGDLAVPLHTGTGQLATPPVLNQKQPIIEATVPVQLRQLLKQCYGLEESADLYVVPNNPNKFVYFLLFFSLFVFYRGQLRTVDLSGSQTIQQSNISPVIVLYTFIANAVERDSMTACIIHIRGSMYSEAFCVNEAEWNKGVSDKEREFLHKERRRTSAYKTSLCSAFRDSGQCPYGFQCRFAHGIAELRPAPGPHPKYKTQLCNKFALYGLCPYGGRCQFIHMRPHEMQNDMAQMNFTTSLDGGANHPLRYGHCSRDTRPPRFYAGNASVVEGAGFDRRDSLSQQCFGSGNNFRAVRMPSGDCDSHAVQSFWHQYRSNADVAGSMERTLSVRPIVGSNRLNSGSTAVDDMFSTMSIGECNNPFTQSCFPRINFENSNRNGAAVSHVRSTDMSYRTP
uniref:C3H1-type domain-containing protein n=1 Tax=Elaeophora elaphi TaxID=1147741 RepID=A0A0R3RZG7_9BILA